MVASGVQFVLVERQTKFFGAVANKDVNIQTFFWMQVDFYDDSVHCIFVTITKY